MKEKKKRKMIYNKENKEKTNENLCNLSAPICVCIHHL